ncbi:exosome complex exonuclease Rrp41 [Candidatus Woesearchaeota archaeon]|nr:exosome complex exonuclease Rrp41 [Candidatus Woesearchaeota archaeon]
MTYDKRYDGRDWTQLRDIEAKAGVIKKADGSAWFRIGKTGAYAAVYGPRELYPKFLQDPEKGVLRCNYNMMPFSGAGERVRPGPSRRSKEISMVTENALRPVLDLNEFPNAVVDVFIELPQTDAGSRCAGICAAAIALADAGIPMKDLVAAVAVGRVDDKLVVDLDYQEEAYDSGPTADIPVAMIPSTGEVTLLQLDGEIKKEQVVQCIELAREAIKNINRIQRDALKDKYYFGDTHDMALNDDETQEFEGGDDSE